MSPKYLISTAASLIALSSTVFGQASFTTNWNPNGEGCVDTKGFLSCYSSQASTATSCTDACANKNTEGTTAYNNCVNGCEHTWLAANVGCWLQGCWNQVYSCEYQLTAMSYFAGTGLVQNAAVPFYPAPVGASAGSCSCNLGLVYGNLTAQATSTAGSLCSAGGVGNGLFTCECCQFSWPLSNILNTCPKSDLSVLGIQKYITGMQSVLSPSTDKCAVLDNGTDICVTKYGFPFAGTTAYNPLNLGSGEPGTEPLTNAAGNAFTAFPVPTTTLSLFPAYTSVITPAAFNAAAGADSNVVTGSGSIVLASPTGSAGGSASSGQSTGTGTAASASGTKASSGSRLEVYLGLISVTVTLFIAVFL